jgi:hypothetical protein
MIAIVMGILAITPDSTHAGLHLGMKLACKRYGDAWNTGDPSALYGAATGEFAAVWSRMPGDDFAKLPRGGRGKVVSSRKGRGSGTVTVATDQGVMTLLLVGRGFHWTVADIYRPGDDGRIVSVKNYVDASLTAREFMQDLKYAGRNDFFDSITPRFQAAFTELSASEFDRVRRFLPDLTNIPKPYVVLDDDRASVRVQIPGQSVSDTITFQLIRREGWRVDDYSVDSRSVQIASFRRSLTAIAAISAFGEFVDDPGSIDPTHFTAPGELRTALLAAQTQKPFPISAPGPRESLATSHDGRVVDVRYPGRCVRLHMVETRVGCGRIDKVEVMLGASWANLATLLNTNQQLRQFSFAAALNQVAGSGQSKAAGAAPAKPARTDVGVVPASSASATENSQEASEVRPAHHTTTTRVYRMTKPKRFFRRFRR